VVCIFGNQNPQVNQIYSRLMSQSRDRSTTNLRHWHWFVYCVISGNCACSMVVTRQKRASLCIGCCTLHL